MVEPLLDNRMIKQLAIVGKDMHSANEAFAKLLDIKKVELLDWRLFCFKSCV